MDYNKISKLNVEVSEIGDELMHDDLIEDVIEEIAPSKAEGVVDYCEKVYLRTRPNKNSEPIKVLISGTRLNIDMENSSEYFYKVQIDNNRFGYVMKNFVRLI